MKNTFYPIDLWEEQEMKYGTGLVHIHDTFWYLYEIKRKISNWHVMEKLKGINGLHVIKRLDGSYYLNQISGYTLNIGAYCYMVYPDGTIKREI